MPSVTRVAALDELETVAGEIAQLHLDLAVTLTADHEAKVRSWFASDAQYITERDRIADLNSLDFTRDVTRLRGELSAAESRRAFLEFVIHWGGE